VIGAAHAGRARVRTGVERVAAYVNVGNIASERVLGRAGFTREGVVRSMPKPDGQRVDKTLFSLLPGE
jgi:RimJ/RimL family protein N-acetyltransferase